MADQPKPLASLPSEDELPGWWKEAVELRRNLHMHPELRFQEKRTARLLTDLLHDAGFSISQAAGTGAVATLVRGEGSTVVLRTDMDALPLDEDSDRPYRSRNDGVMHACGHDVHMAVVVTAARLLATSDGWQGSLAVILQPAEEIPYGETSGAAAMIESGLVPLDGTTVLGLHSWPWLPVGTVGLDPTIAMASKDAFRIEMLGKTSHAASPAEGRDALLAMSTFVSMIYGLLFRRLNSSERVAFNVGTIKSEFGQSIVADSAHVVGTLRTVDPEVRGLARRVIEETARGIAIAHDCRQAITWANEMPTLQNDPGLVELAIQTIGGLQGIEAQILDNPPMTTDDFALYAERTSSLYIKLGTSSGSSITPLHNSAFDVDERSIWVGVETLAELVKRSLAKSERAL